jgi:DNA-directed RNA polymerase specialized sigma24 family protein
MANVESLTVELADGNEPAAVLNHIDSHHTTSSRSLKRRGGLHDLIEGETVALNRQAYRPASASGEGEPHGGVEGVESLPPIHGCKWCPNHLEAIRLNDAGICPVCLIAPGPFRDIAEPYKPAPPTSAEWHAHEPPHPRCSYCPEHRCTKCPKGWTFGICEYDTVVPRPAQVPRQDVALDTAESRPAAISLSYPAKGCAAPSALYETGSYYGRDGEREFVWYEATCVNGHSHLASRLAPEDVEPEPPAVKAAPVPADVRSMFDRVLETHYGKLLRIARNMLYAFDGGRIPGAEDCVQEAVAALVRDGSYAACAGEGEMFGQLVVTVRNRAKATIKDWARDRKRQRSLITEHVRRRRWSDGNDEIVGKGSERELASDGGRRGSQAADSELRPRPVETTRDLRIDGKWALFEAAVPLDAQAVLVSEATRREMIGRFGPRMRHLRTTPLDRSILEHRKRLTKRLADHRPAPGAKRQKSPHDGRMVPDYSAHRKFIRRWVDDAPVEFRKARQQL